MSVYFIGVPTGMGQEHMTLKFLGELSDNEARSWARQMDMMAQSVQSFPMISEGLGMLGKHKTHLVNFIKPNKRLEKALSLVGNNLSSQPPHVTVHGLGRAGQLPINTGPVSSMDNVLAETVNLYRAQPGGNYDVVYSVKLKRRSPITWIKDKLGFSKFAELNMNKTAKVMDVIKWPGERIGFAINKGLLEAKLQNIAFRAKMIKDVGKRQAFINAQSNKALNQMALARKSHNAAGHFIAGTGAVALGTAGYNLAKSAEITPEFLRQRANAELKAGLAANKDVYVPNAYRNYKGDKGSGFRRDPSRSWSAKAPGGMSELDDIANELKNMRKPLSKGKKGLLIGLGVGAAGLAGLGIYRANRNTEEKTAGMRVPPKSSGFARYKELLSGSRLRDMENPNWEYTLKNALREISLENSLGQASFSGDKLRQVTDEIGMSFLRKEEAKKVLRTRAATALVPLAIAGGAYGINRISKKDDQQSY